MPKQLKVLFLPTANAGVVWHRMMKFFKWLRKDPSMNPAMDSFDPKRMTPYEWQFYAKNNKMLLTQIEYLVKQADVVVMGYVISDYGIALIKALKKLFPEKPILMEMDDYCLGLNDYSPAFNTYKPGSEAADAVVSQMQIVDGMVVTTEYLKKLYKPYNKRINIVENCIDFEIWNNLKPIKKRGKKLRIGWIGASTHNEDLKYIEKSLYRILEKHKNVEMYICGGAPQFMIGRHPRIKCDNKWVDVYKYPQSLKNRCFDIGLAPLLDNNFNRAKSNLRWLEYSALGIPTVASRVEPFSKSIEYGKTGYLCSEPDEWVEALSILIENPSKRKELGSNAKKEVEINYNIKNVAKRYGDILKEFSNGVNRPKGKSKAIKS